MNKLQQYFRIIRKSRNFPGLARKEYLRDHLGFPRRDPGIEKAIDCGVAWLCLAQDESYSRDGGVAEWYSLLTGWSISYPETTGYIIPTILDYARSKDDNAVRDRATLMLDWLVSIQFQDGSFPGGNIKAQPRKPTIFNTGQILLGLASGVTELDDKYYVAMCRAADWLVKAQEKDGSWRKHISPFVVPGEKTYHTHVAWGLLEADHIEPNKGYADAALANIYWALTQQTSNGWFRNCSLDDPFQPLSHTLGYTLRGLLEAYQYSGNNNILVASQKTADGILSAMDKDGFLPGRLQSDWQGSVSWACLTGTVQIAHCWLLLYRFSSEVRFRNAGYTANRFVRRLMHISGPIEQKGGVSGSFPIDGEYGAFCYLNWACKFLIDSNSLEKQIRELENQ